MAISLPHATHAIKVPTTVWSLFAYRPICRIRIRISRKLRLSAAAAVRALRRLMQQPARTMKAFLIEIAVGRHHLQATQTVFEAAAMI
jgi:hypothetical protein